MGRHLACVYRTPDGWWHFCCGFCTKMNGFESWRVAYESAQYHLTSYHEPAREGTAV